MSDLAKFLRGESLRLFALLLSSILTGTILLAQTDPFVGTWIYNAQKSPKPTVKYAIKDLGGDRYSLTGSTGITIEVKADGASTKTTSGATVAFSKLDDHNWKLVRDDGQKLTRTYNVSADDKTLTLHDVYSGDVGDNYETTTKYARLAAGKGIFGDWQSVSMEEKAADEGLTLIIAPFESDGLSFSVPARKHLSEMKFDGKVYPNSGPGDTHQESSSGKRISDHVLQIDGQAQGKLEDTEEFKLSDDGKTLTIISKVAQSGAIFTMVWDKR